VYSASFTNSNFKTTGMLKKKEDFSGVLMQDDL